jgi:hypothetical protein
MVVSSYDTHNDLRLAVEALSGGNFQTRAVARSY